PRGAVPNPARAQRHRDDARRLRRRRRRGGDLRRSPAGEPRLQRIRRHGRRHHARCRITPWSVGQVPGGGLMGIFSRLGTLIKSNINDLISKAEDPEKMLSQVLVDMKNQLVEAKKQVAVAIGDEKRLKKQWDEQVANAKEWERKAMMAVHAGDD